jgi:putative colanic acid biosynthesis acetyltransferase WcaF
MKMFFIHDQTAPDPYLRAAFSFRHRLMRLIWRICWQLLCRPTPVIFHGWRAQVVKFFGAKLGANNLIYPKAMIWAPWLLTTGNLVTIADNVEIYNPGGLTLDHHAILSQGSYICGGTHDYNNTDFPMLSKHIHICAYAWICARAVVLPGVVVGEGAVLGAAAVTSRDLEPWTVYVGNPAQKAGDRKNFTDALKD